MPLFFVDRKGNEGHVGEDLSVEYDGPADVDAFVEGVVEDGTPADDTFEDLLIDLPQELPIEKVTRE